MELIILLIACATVWEIQRLLVRKQLDLLNQTLDTIVVDSALPNLDFFRSKGLRKYLSNAMYAKILNTKAERIREGLRQESPDMGQE